LEVSVASVRVAAESFADALEELGFATADVGDPADIGRRAALLVSADRLWADHLGPLLDGKQVQHLLGLGTRQGVHDLVKRRRLLALPGPNGRAGFPAFQFNASGRIEPVLHSILETFAAVVASPYTIASWFATAQPALDGLRPIDWLRQGGSAELLQEAARRSAARLGQ
jgi:hypothetical protein